MSSLLCYKILSKPFKVQNIQQLIIIVIKLVTTLKIQCL